MFWTILGCGGSLGIPLVGCACAVCTSDDPRNQRTRSAGLITSATTTILIDAGPDFRIQALRAGISRLDAVVLTHEHQDHIGGIDDLRAINFSMKASLPIYGSAATLARVRYQYDYAFAPEESLSTRPALILHEIDEAPFTIGDITLTPLPVVHGAWRVFGYRVGDLAYLTDTKEIPDATRERLAGVDTVIIDALRHTDHPLHFTVAEALAEIERIQPRRAFFTHMSHDLDYAATDAATPAHVAPAYDGLRLECFNRPADG